MAAAVPSVPTGLGFVELDAYATSVVGPAAKVRATYGQGPGGPIVIPLFSNAGFMPFLRNVICSMRRLHVNNWLVIAMDNATCPTLMGTPGDGEQSACVYPYAHSSMAVTTNNNVATYRSVNFNRMVMQRPLWVRWLLQQGYSVLQCDLDLVWLHDPQPVLRALRLTGKKKAVVSSLQTATPGASVAPTAPTVESKAPRWSSAASGNKTFPDMLFQSEQAYGLNGGFYFARPSVATLAFYEAWVERLKVMINMPSFEEQHALNSGIRRVASYTSEKRLRYQSLDDYAFPNGKIWWSYPWHANKRVAYIVHANWNKQQKKSRMSRDGLWFLTPDDKQCDAAFDPMARGCHKLCYPIAYAAPGGRPMYKKCHELNREDDYQARRHGSRWASKNHTWTGDFGGLFWHPKAYEGLPNCKRDLTKIPIYAEACHQRLVDMYWGDGAKPSGESKEGAPPASVGGDGKPRA